jgi:transposase InsO family protein
MSKNRVIVLSVIQQGLTKPEVASKYGVTWRWVHTLITRYNTGGLDAVDPQHRRPHTNARAIAKTTRDRIITLRHELTNAGFDAGAETIATHLKHENIHPPARSTINRILTTAGLITPEPRKRPKTSYIRFQAAQPNETWQSDFTHWHLADGTDIEIINWLDDHSRLLLHQSAHNAITGEIVTDTFTATINAFGPPQSTLTDNGRVYTARFGGGRNAFEYLLAALGIQQKNGSPGHPQTQGKIERFHQTQKKWLNKQPPAETLEELQQQLNEFENAYNTKRPHRALDGHTPEHAYTTTPKAAPRGTTITAHYRIRTDRLDPKGKATLRRAGILHHLNARTHNARKKVLMLIDETTVTITELHTGEILSQHHINPEKKYWPDQLKPAGRWPTNTPQI